jgi:hypothetical protein
VHQAFTGLMMGGISMLNGCKLFTWWVPDGYLNCFQILTLQVKLQLSLVMLVSENTAAFTHSNKQSRKHWTLVHYHQHIRDWNL